jgi:hypothetical protein
MQIDAIYEHGKLIFNKTIRLRQEKFPVRVELPDEMLEVTDDSKRTRPSDPWMDRLEEIKQQVIKMSENNLPELSMKDEAYMRAFSLRNNH